MDNNAVKKLNKYQKLLGDKEWRKLHPAIQKRFSDENLKQVTYKGKMSEVYLSFAGKLFAQACRLIGTPLALYNGKDVPMTVKVFANKKNGGVTWERLYHYTKRKANRVISTKCIDQDGLAEMIGCGLGMQLNTCQKERSLVFESDYYFLKIGKLKLSIPDWLTPGKTIVTQRAINDEEFEFSLEVKHSILGLVYYQIGNFKAEPQG